MKNVFEIGSVQTYEIIVAAKDTATFDSGRVHPVYATFALGRDAEWCCRLFVLEMKEDDEEGIGTFLSVEHKQPALIGEKVKFIAIVSKLDRNEIICTYEAFVGQRMVAKGEQGQKILKKERLEKLFNDISQLNN
ncbi:MAG: hypothetical protein SGJ00_09000 [bacterium]|nr:hypothetical protein [bacterium]